MGKLTSTKVVNFIRQGLANSTKVWSGTVSSYAAWYNAISPAAWLTIMLLMQPAVLGADFSRAKKTYVPPTRIPRTAGYEVQREIESLKGTKQAGHADFMLGKKSGAGVHTATAKLTPAEVTNLRLKAEGLIKRGNLEQANELLKQCFANQSENTLVQNDLLKVNMSRSRQFEKAKKLDQAIAASREAIYFSPDSVASAELLTRQLKQKGFDSSNPEVRLDIAQKLFAAKRLAPALVEYCQSYKLKPTAAAAAGLGNVYQTVGKSSLAEEQYKLAVQIDPRCSEAYRQLGLLRLADKDIVNANSDLGKALELDGNDTIASKALIGLWEEQVSSSPNTVNTHLGLARAYQLSGKLSLARTEYDTVAEIEPSNPTLKVARASLERAVARQQSTQAIKDARSLETQGAFEEAKNRLGAALSDDPKNSELLLLQGEVLEKMGKASDAADAYRAVLYADPNNAEAARRLKSLSEGSPNFSVLPAPVKPEIVSSTAKVMPAGDSSVITPVGSDVAKLTNFLLDIRNYVNEQQKAIRTAKHESSKPKS